MTEEIVISSEDLKSYEYLERKYHEIVSFLGKNSGFFDPVKLPMFFEKTVLTFDAWNKSRMKEISRNESTEEVVQ